MSDLVSGAEGVLKKIEARLTTALPYFIEMHAHEINEDPAELVKALTPKLIAVSERTNLSLNDYPAFLLTPDNVTGHQTVSAEIGRHPAFETDPDAYIPRDGVQHRRSYPIRIWGYVQDERADFDITATMRNRLELCTWRCLFSDLELAQNAVLSADRYEVNFSAVVADRKAQRTMAGFYAAMVVNTTESLTTPTVSVADTIEVLESRLT